MKVTRLSPDEKTLLFNAISGEMMKRVEKPWGHELFIGPVSDKFMKIIYIRKGWKTSKHYHKTRDETLILLDGTLDFDFKGTIKRMVPYDHVSVHPNAVHQLIAIQDCRILEITSSLEGDVWRVKDPYGRGNDP